MRRIAVVAAIALGACKGEAPPHAPPPPPPPPPIATVTPPPAPAPVRVVQRSADSRIVSFRIAFAAGSSDDPRGKEGLTALTANVMAEGGTKALTYAQLVEKLYPMAASIDVNVDRDETVFTAEVAAASLDSFYPLLRDVLLTPRLDDESFTRLRTRQASAITSDLRGSDDELLGKEALQALVYEGHPYGHPPRGTERGVAAATLDDVAKHRTHVFCKERLLLGIAGGFPQGFEDTVSRDLAQLPACDGPRPALPPPPDRKGLHVRIVDKPSADAAAISIGFPTPITRASADYPGLLFATDFLGLHRQSAGLLFQELREKRGLNYGDYAYAEFFEQAGHGRYPKPNVVRRQELVSIWLRPVKQKNAIFALRAALFTYGKMVNGGIAKADLDRFRTFLTRYIGLEEQTESRRLGYGMDDVVAGLKAPYLDTIRKGFADLDDAKLNALIKAQLTTKDLQIAIVSKDAEALAAALVRGDASPPTYDGPKPPEVKAEDQDIEKLALPIKAEDVKVVPVGEMFK